MGVGPREFDDGTDERLSHGAIEEHRGMVGGERCDRGNEHHTRTDGKRASHDLISWR
jgi:hypothetical protein